MKPISHPDLRTNLTELDTRIFYRPEKKYPRGEKSINNSQKGEPTLSRAHNWSAGNLFRVNSMKTKQHLNQTQPITTSTSTRRIFHHNQQAEVQDPEARETSIQDGRVQSGCKSKKDYESTGSRKNRELQSKIFEKRLEQLTKGWAQQKNHLKGQIRRLEFIVRKWQQLDRQNHKDKKLKETKDAASSTLANTEPQETLSQHRSEPEGVKKESNQNLLHIHGTPRFNEQSATKDKDVRSHLVVNRLRLEYQEEQTHIHQQYNKMLAQKQCVYNALLTNYHNLQEQLEQEKHDMVTLLERKKIELDQNVNNIRNQYEAVVRDLKETVDRMKLELLQNRDMQRRYENELERKDDHIRHLEYKIQGNITQHETNRLRMKIAAMEQLLTEKDAIINNLKSSTIMSPGIRSLNFGDSPENNKMIAIHSDQQCSPRDNFSELSNETSRTNILKTSYEATISNLTSQMTMMKTKLDGLQTRFDIKCRELKEKDTFVKNVIVSRMGRQPYQTETQYVMSMLQKFFQSKSDN